MLDKILMSGIGSTAEKLAGAVRQFVTTDADETKLRIEMEKVLQSAASEQEQTLRAELQLRERVMVAELEQGDSYTKRARPTIIYAGLGMIAWNYCLVPIIGVDNMQLPAEFWYSWSAVVGIYGVGRSAEKIGVKGKAVTALTGNPKRSSLID